MILLEGETREIAERRLYAEALAEHRQWVRRLEMERWTTSGQDPDLAIANLIAREQTAA